MTGSVRHIKDDRYCVIVYAGLDERTGKERYRSKSYRADGPQKANKLGGKLATELLEEIEQGKVVRGTVAGYVDTWLKENERTKSPTTMAGYRTHCAAIVREFGRMKIDELKPKDVRAWYARLATDTGQPGQKNYRPGMSQATIRHYHSTLRSICRQAWFDGEVTRPATAGVKLPPLDQKAMELPTDQAMMAIISHATGDLAVALRLIAATGLRRGELVALRWSDLHGTELHIDRAAIEIKGGVRIKAPKGRRSRVVALDHQTMRMLARHRSLQVAYAEQLGATIAKRADRAVLANLAVDPTGQKAYRPGWLSHGWERVRRLAGAEHVTLHQTRHWNATVMLDAGMTMADVAEHHGHADPAVTARIYAHSRKGRGKIGAKFIGEAMKALPKG